MKEKTIWHNIGWEKAVELLNSDYQNGLSESEIKFRWKEFGKNKLPEEKSLSQIKIFLDQLRNPLVYILIVAGIITFFLGEYNNSIVIFVAVTIHTLVGYIQESKSSKALSKLKKVLSIKATVLRQGKEQEILASDLVPGDVISLKAGDKIPADGRLIKSYDLKINESSLTGEWLANGKNTDPLPEETPLANRENMIYMGTAVEDGKGRAIVTGTGLKTEIGEVTDLVRETKEGKTPYQIKIAHFSKVIGIIIGLMCTAIFIQGLVAGGNFIEVFTTAVAVAVASIPEGLPISMTVILAIGMQRIFKKNGLVRKLSATETLGNTSIIATDKTGTLTEGKMTVAGIYTFLPKNQEAIVLKNAILCSESFIENPDAQKEEWKVRGMPTEKALVLAGVEYGLFKNQLEKLNPKIDEIPFSSAYKYSASLRELSIGELGENSPVNDSKNYLIYVKGAPEIILEKSKYYELNNELVEISVDERLLLNNKYEELTSNGYRVLGVARKKIGEISTMNFILKESINDLVFSGFIYLEDPIRKEAKEAIQTCFRAGMRPIIITGDHKLTAKAVANKLGFNIRDENILEGKDLEKMSDIELDKKLEDIQIFARVEPKHKLRIVNAWQKKGEVVAMTGDGINDAPALKQADIGVALGSGTEVAKEVSDLVLLTDDFSIIVSAVKEGRAILDNIRKVITYLLSDSFTEVILIGVSIVAGLPLPVTAVQILWINLIEDGLPNIALAFEPKEKDLMKRKPQKQNMSLLTREMKIIIFGVGLITDMILLGIYFWLSSKGLDIHYLRTMIFACLAIDSISYVFCCKSLRNNLWNTNLLDNKLLIGSWFVGLAGLLSAIYLPILNVFLGTVPLLPSDWLVITCSAVINIILIETVKYYFIIKNKTEI